MDLKEIENFIKEAIPDAIIENEMYINDKTKVTIDELSTSNKSWLANYMSK